MTTTKAEPLTQEPPGEGDQVRTFPNRRLPSRFLLSMDNPPHPPASPAPSATLILIREGREAPEILLLRRHPRSGFIPGAWVFPGGRVDPGDGDETLLRTLTSGPENTALLRFRAERPEFPALAYWIAAVREAFEETGIFPGLEGMKDLQVAQARLLNGTSAFREILARAKRPLELNLLKYIGHWLTPECEPRRYETRFFISRVRGSADVRPHRKELVEYLWLTPHEALALNREGALPLVLPTLVTLEELLPFGTVGDAIRILGSRPVPRRLPIPDQAPGGIRFRIPA